MAQDGILDGRRALVTGGESGFGAALLEGLCTRGARAESIAIGDPSREGVHASFDAAVAALGGLDVVVHAALDPSLLESRALCETSGAQWEQGCEACLRTAVFVLQASYRHLRGRGGRIVLVTPAVSTAGAAGLVPLTTAVESIRIVAKTAAKQWGSQGITVNSLAPGLDALFDSSQAPRVALGEPGLPDFDPQRDVAPVLGFLSSEEAGTLTGATLRVDGGVWMAG